ncbi:MAG: hypothetical protein ACSHX6_07590 [Akkermansiaceae bacterium]
MAFAILSFSQLTASARLEQVLLPVNDKDKKVTFTFYHFDSSKSASLTNVKENIGESTTNAKAVAGISASATTNISYQSGKFTIPNNALFVIQNGALTGAVKTTGIHKHTLVLTDGKGRHAIAYTPNVSTTELGFALKNFLTSSKTKFTTAIITDSGNQCGFYKKNGNYNPYYLKELKKPVQAIIVK